MQVLVLHALVRDGAPPAMRRRAGAAADGWNGTSSPLLRVLGADPGPLCAGTSQVDNSSSCPSRAGLVQGWLRGPWVGRSQGCAVGSCWPAQALGVPVSPSRACFSVCERGAMVTLGLQREHGSVQLGGVLFPTATTGLMVRREPSFFLVILFAGNRKNFEIQSLWGNHAGEQKESDSSFYVCVFSLKRSKRGLSQPVCT